MDTLNYLEALLGSPELMQERMEKREQRLRKQERHRARLDRERDRWSQSKSERDRNAARLLVRVHGVRSRGR